MAKIAMTDARIVADARRKFGQLVALGEPHDVAANKAMLISLGKLWRRKPVDMSKPSHVARYGQDWDELKQLVTGVSHA